MTEKTNIIIGTTSLNRPVLHNDIFPDWIKWLNNINKDKYRITWFINIDIIQKLDVTHDETVMNYNNLINGMFNVHYLKCDNNEGNFLKACKRLATNIEKYVNSFKNKEDTKIIWLEDDWKLDPSKIIDINTLLESYSTNMSSINLTFIRDNYIHALAPSLISYNLWKTLHYQAWIEQESDIDPEHCVGVYFVKNFCKYMYVTNLTIINRKVEDGFLGRSFLNNTNSYYTYHNEKYRMNNHVNDPKKFVDKKEIKKKFSDIVSLMRITPTVCVDGCNYGRKFMETHDLKKNIGKYDGNFYV